jgi:hypothetical protein
MTIEERFSESYQRVKKKGYTPHRFLEMVAEHGHVKTVKMLLVPCGMHYREGCYRTIYDLGMPEESIESIAYFEFLEHFTPEELAEARRRLVDCQVKYVKTMRVVEQHELIEAYPCPKCR